MEKGLTEVFTLPSGVECEITELSGKEQRLLTEQKHKKLGDNLNEVILSILVRLGSVKVFTIEDVKNLLSEDRKLILWKARRFAIDEAVFKFGWDYISRDSQKNITHPLEVELDADFEVKPYADQWDEYTAINKNVELVLTRTGKRVRFTMLDGNGEQSGALTKKDERSSHTPLLMRNPVEFMKTTGDEIPVKINLDKLPLMDIEQLRTAIKNAEGKVPTELRFEHPEAEYMSQAEKMVVLDLLGQLAFFFPSGAI